MTAATAKATTAMVPSTGVNADLVEKAVSALLKYHEHQTSKASEAKGTLPLLGDDRPVQVQINLDRIPAKHVHKPTRILIPHPLYKVHSSEEKEDDRHNNSNVVGVEEPSVCIIVKDESKVWVKEMVARFAKHMGCVKKVLGLDSLRKKHSRYEQRRELLHKYDVFMVDDRILPMVGKALGRDFYKYKRLPIPIKLTRKEALPFAVQNALKATFLTLSQGDCLMVRAGNTGMPLQSLVENVVAICENAVPKIPKKWANIRAIAIKTPESTSLPIYNKTPQELMEIARLAGLGSDKTVDQEEEKEEDDDDDDKEVDDKREQESQKKKKKIVSKSPLVRAVKRQLDEAKEEKEPSPTKKHKTETKETKETPTNPKESQPKKSKKQKNSNEDDVKTSIIVDDSKTLKEASKDLKDESKPRKSPKSKRDAQPNEEASVLTPKSKKAKSDNATPSSRDQKAPKTTAEKEKAISRDTEDSSKLKKKSKTPTTPKQEDAKVSTPKQSSEKPVFVPSPKFKGSKSGYIFKSGDSGVGYYVDVKPVVDPMVLEAFTRARKSPASGGRHNSSSNKANRNQGKRKSRHSR